MGSESGRIGSRFIVRLIVTGVFAATIAGLILFWYIPMKRQDCDRAASADASKLGAAIERFNNELDDLGCRGEKWEWSQKHFMFLVGPYYGWGGTNRKCRVRVRLEGANAVACSMRGTPMGDDGEDRYLYRVSTAGGKDVPTVIGPCYGNAYGGRGAMCFTESMVNDDCSFATGPPEATPEEQAACSAVAEAYPDHADTFRRLVADRTNPFALDLYRALRTKEDNLFVAPFLAYSQFTVLAEKSSGETRAEIMKALKGDNFDRSTMKNLGLLTRAVRCAVVLGGGQLSVEDHFMGLGKRELKPLDTSLGSEPDAAEEALPPQISEEEIVPRGVTDDGLLILQAGWKQEVYFLGKWSRNFTFQTEQTKTAPFYLLNGKEVPVPLMRHFNMHYRYGEGDDYQALEIAYRGDDVSMVVLLPRERDGLPDFERTLNDKKFRSILEDLHPWGGGVRVWLPRFGASHQADLVTAGNELGIHRVFQEDDAEMGTAVPQAVDVWIESMMQSAWVEVDEKGTEAYAAGTVCQNITATNGGGGPGEPPPPKIFRADHPFIFVIRHNPSNCIFFMGRLARP